MRCNWFGATRILIGPERAHNEIGILRRSLPYSRNDVRSFVNDVDAVISGVEHDALSRMIVEEVREESVKPLCRRPVNLRCKEKCPH